MIESFFDELEKIAEAEGLFPKEAQSPIGAIAGALAKGAKNPSALKHLKYPAILAGGAGSALLGQQAFKDWKLGRQVRKQHGM